MKKNYFSYLFVSLMLLLAVPADAQISAIVDLYGKYKFTATVEVVDASYSDTFANAAESEVTITSSSGYQAGITGFAGSSETILVNSWDAETQGMTILNPNYPQIFSGLDMTWYEGTYPYVWNHETLLPYNSIVYTYDAATQTITVPDFSIVECNHAESSATILARFTNVKMTLVEAETVEIVDLTGEWTYEAYAVRNDSTFATTFTIDIAKTDDTNKAYNTTFTIGDFEPFTLPATFDGLSLTIPYENLYLSLEDSIRFGSWTKKSGSFVFNLTTKNKMTQDGYWIVTRDTIYTWDEAGDSLAVNPAERLQYYYSGGKITREDPNAFNWLGTYTVTIPEGGMNSLGGDYTFPTEFEIVFEEKYDYIYMTWFMGEDIYSTCNTTFVVEGTEDGTSATIDLSTSYYGPLIKSNGDGTFLRLSDVNGQASKLTLTQNEDGTYKMSDFWISYYVYGGEDTFLCGFSGATVEKVVEEPFNWAGTYNLTSTVTAYDGETYPETFEVVVEHFDTEYVQGYYITSFMGLDITALNNWGSGIKLTIAEDGNSAKIPAGGYLKSVVAGEVYLKLFDLNASTSDINFTLNEDGTVSMDNFTVVSAGSQNTTAALYKNVVLTKGVDTAIDSVNEDSVVGGIYDLSGRKVDSIATPGIYIVNGKKVIVK